MGFFHNGSTSVPADSYHSLELDGGLYSNHWGVIVDDFAPNGAMTSTEQKGHLIQHQEQAQIKTSVIMPPSRGQLQHTLRKDMAGTHAE